MKIASDFTDFLFYIYLQKINTSITETIVSEDCFLLIDKNKRWIGIEYNCAKNKRYSDTIIWDNTDKDITKLKQEMNIDFVGETVYGIEIIFWNENKFIDFNKVKKLI